jgi:hypothetical protein
LVKFQTNKKAMAATPVTMYPARLEEQEQEQEYDIEKSSPELKGDAAVHAADSEDSPSVERAKRRTGPLWRVMDKLSGYGVEETGIERVLPHERTNQSPMATFTMWFVAPDPYLSWKR